MLGDIDKNKKPQKIKIFLSKPNREVIAKLSEAFGIKRDIKITSLNELEFRLPYYVTINNELVKNRNIDLLKERYLLKVVVGAKIEWYVITNIGDNMGEDGDYKEIQAYYLPYQLGDKSIRTYSKEAVDMREALSDVLSEVNWGIGSIDADFEITRRSFEFNKITVLDAVYKIAEAYNAIIEWDTENRLIHCVKPELHGVDRGLVLSYGKYLQSLGREYDANEMVTRLRAWGKDGLSIHEVNPTGQNFIQDFSYFIFPFQRDEQGNVIEHSYYLSDSLCHALLDYDALVESKKGEFGQLIREKRKLQEELSQLEIELNALKNQEAQITDIVLQQQFDENMWFEKFIYQGSRAISTTQVRPEYAYVVLCKVSNDSGITVKLDGIQKNVKSGTWVSLGKIRYSNFVTVEIDGESPGVEIFIQIANITTDEFEKTLNENELIEKYSLDNKQMQIEAKENKIYLIKEEMKLVDNKIQDLNELLSMENNFTREQLEELNDYIIVQDFEDDNIVDPDDLYEMALEKFKELRKPQMIIKLNMINFLEIISEQGNWDKLNLGDYVTIKYEKLNIRAKAKIIEISYDYEEPQITLTIANVTDINDNAIKFDKLFYKAINTSSVVSMERNKWGKAVVDSSEISQLFENIYNKITNDINMASNQYTVLDRKGLTIYDPHDPQRFLRATNGALALTRSGGLRYETAITPDGIIAERLFGKILLTQRVVIGDDDGILEIHGAKATITDRCGREVMKFGLYDENPDKFGIALNRYESDECSNTNIINRVIMDKDDGFKIQRRDNFDFEDTVWLDPDGVFHGKGVRIDYIEGTLSNGIVIDPIDGIIVTRSDGLVRSKLNATEGIGIERFENGQWSKKLYLKVTGEFMAEDLIAKRLRIVNDFDELMLDSKINYLNIGRFEYIITDGKLTPIEKLTLKQEWETIQTEYQKLLYQANQYKTSKRDNHTRILIDIPPFVAAYEDLGNYVEPLLADMTVTTPVDREVFKNKFQKYYDEARRIINEITNALKYSSLQLGESYNRVTIDATNGILVERGDGRINTVLNATDGIYIARYENGTWKKKFYVDTNGILHAEDLIAHRLKIYGSAGNVLIDGNTNFIDFGGFDVGGVARLAAELIASKMVIADDAYINDLTVNRLKTLNHDIPVGSYVDHVDIRDNYASWITARVGDRVQAKDSLGRLLYFTDESKRLVTTENTGIPFYQYVFDEEKVKLKFYFNGSGDYAYPVSAWGLGSGAGSDDDFSGRGKGYIYKDHEEFVIKYNIRMTDYSTQLKLHDGGIALTAENSSFSVHSTNSLIKSEGGYLKFEHASGSFIEITSNGDININARGNVKINGNRIDLN